MTWKNGAAFVAEWSYTYDTRGRVSSVAVTHAFMGGTGAASTTTYGYDALYRLTSEHRAGANALPLTPVTSDLALQ